MGALSGVQVLEIGEGWTATALAGKLLAELGAEVVKLEPEAGDSLRLRGPFDSDGSSYSFQLAAALKDSMVLPSGGEKEALEALARRADVLLVDGEEWWKLHSQGITGERLLEDNPRLVLCVPSPFGLYGPLSRWTGCELILQSMAGLMATTGFPGDPPTRSGVPIITGMTAFYSATAIQAALYERRRSGLGQVIDVAGYDVAITTLVNHVVPYFRYGQSAHGVGNRHPLIVPWNAFQACDGWIQVCTAGERLWPILMEVIGRPELKEEPRYQTTSQRLQYVDEIDAIIAAWVRPRTVAEVTDTLTKNNLPSGPVVPVAQLFQQPYFRERNMLMEVPKAEGGNALTTGTMLNLSATPGRVARSAPGLGPRARGSSAPRGEAPAPRTRNGPMPRHNGDKPLSGVRVVEVGQFTAGPYGVRLLGLLGADVIKVEPIGGEPMRQMAVPLAGESGDSYVFHLVNADKKSVTLDLSSPRGKELFLEIIEHAHVFAVNLSADFTARVGIDYASLKKVNPGLVYCSVTGFGSEGTWRQRRALDTVLQALGGVMDLTGFPENPPLKVGVSLVDLAGGLFASAAVLAALQHQADTGEGQLVDVAMSDVAAWFSAEVWPLPLAGQEVSRVGNHHWFHAPHNLYQAQDRPVVVGVEKDGQWQALLGAMGRRDLLGDSRYATSEDRVRQIEEVDRLVEEWANSLKAADVVSRCQAAGVPAALVQEMDEVVEHPNTRERETIIERSGYRIFGAPIKFSRTPLTVEDLGPALGQDNDEVLGGLLGLSRDQREHLKAEGVI